MRWNWRSCGDMGNAYLQPPFDEEVRSLPDAKRRSGKRLGDAYFYSPSGVEMRSLPEAKRWMSDPVAQTVALAKATASETAGGGRRYSTAASMKDNGYELSTSMEMCLGPSSAAGHQLCEQLICACSCS